MMAMGQDTFIKDLWGGYDGSTINFNFEDSWSVNMTGYLIDK